MDHRCLAEWERRCQKPDHRRVGNWMARHVSRPLALRLVREIAPWPISAHLATLAAWGCGVGAALAAGWGTVAGWLLAAALLQVWYLLDHVDGQLARLRRTASLDGVQLDYLMHHTVHLLIPLGLGWGLFVRTTEPGWACLGLLWGVALLLLTLQHDTRYKAFVQRLKRLRGELHVVGGGGGRPQPPPPIPRRPLKLLAYHAPKSCEMHVVMNLLALVAVVEWLSGPPRPIAVAGYLSLAAPMACLVAAATLIRSQRAGAAETEFAAWYRVPAGYTLEQIDGWWMLTDGADMTDEPHGLPGEVHQVQKSPLAARCAMPKSTDPALLDNSQENREDARFGEGSSARPQPSS